MNMSQVWAILVGAIILLIVYGIISSKLSESKRKKEKEKYGQRAEEMIRAGGKYNFLLGNGRMLAGMIFVGPMISAEAQFDTGWEGMIILRNDDGKKFFVKQSTIRLVEQL
jgi:hypothetical protein